MIRQEPREIGLALERHRCSPGGVHCEGCLIDPELRGDPPSGKPIGVEDLPKQGHGPYFRSHRCIVSPHRNARRLEEDHSRKTLATVGIRLEYSLIPSHLHMPPTRRDRHIALTPPQVEYVLDSLLRQRRLSQRDIDRALADMQREIDEVTSRLAILRASQQAPNGRGRARSTAPMSASRRQRKPVSAETHASRELQGRYLGLIRQLPARRRGSIKKVAKTQGREAAIQAMLALRES